MKNSITLFSAIVLFLCIGCNQQDSQPNINKKAEDLSLEFKEYWFNGEAEITSYQLSQFRYGEKREGNAILIYVTEDFLPNKQVKANNQNDKNIGVLKLNATKNFITGIYPYSIMQSTFYPLSNNEHALKITASIQEWCGQVFMQLNNRNDFEIKSHSYFEEEADKNFKIDKTVLENELWTQLRINPETMPTGEIDIIPAFEYLRLAHKETKAYNATAEFFKDENLNVYKITYPALNRVLKIYFNPTFPFEIEKWEETLTVIINGIEEKQTTTAIKSSRIKSAYWTLNKQKDLPLRTQLNLE